ncbi:MAG: hydroxymethylglutaryl-CoA reductase, degradative [Thermoplasmata archaeon]|nr:hydroxymethylglutaryl-CoA reductase, degradative [Thermoplasmata archaeon]MBE3137728.1 hydroxymethylglutaryl-CoA reductase, degradative [Thermoplasmata archaeon]MBE3141830.1 hydroxymethylglutaryl-CoA reductase, degradative [Thermoplasmata archaeon]
MSTTEKTSVVSGFYKLPIEKRREFVTHFANLSEDDAKIFSSCLDLATADRMIENVLGTFELPLGLAVNFLINGKDYIIPMATEESSVVAAASNAAKIARIKGGFSTTCSEPLMIGQLQLLHIGDVVTAAQEILKHKEQLLALANSQDKILVDLGGGARDLEVRILDSPLGTMIVTHLIVDVRDAMGANAVNTMCEALAPMLEEISGGKVRLKILSNLADKRLVKATAVFDKEKMGGDRVVDAFLESYTLASIDPYRAATHNKGIMNGIDALIIATGNDSRAIEAGAHAYAARDGQYTALTRYHKNNNGDLVGEIELPMAVGVVGGAANMHPKAKLCRKILGISSARELAEVVASLGLAQNFAALLALSTVGIQKGHMSLHAKNIAVMAGAQRDEIEKLADQLVHNGKVKLDYAKELLEKMRKKAK